MNLYWIDENVSKAESDHLIDVGMLVPVVGPVYRPDYEAMAKRVTDATYALDDWTEAQVVDLMRVAVGLVEVGEETE